MPIAVHVVRIALVGLLASFIACSQPLLDTTSEQAYDRSREEMLRHLDSVERHELEHALDIIGRAAWDSVDLSKSGYFAEETEARLREGVLEYMKRVHGMNASELISFAKSLPSWVDPTDWTVASDLHSNIHTLTPERQRLNNHFGIQFFCYPAQERIRAALYIPNAASLGIPKDDGPALRGSILLNGGSPRPVEWDRRRGHLSVDIEPDALRGLVQSMGRMEVEVVNARGEVLSEVWEQAPHGVEQAVTNFLEICNTPRPNE